MAQVALLHTEMNSGFRFVPRIGMNSAAGHTHEKMSSTYLNIEYALCVAACERDNVIITNARFDMRKACLG